MFRHRKHFSSVFSLSLCLSVSHPDTDTRTRTHNLHRYFDTCLSLVDLEEGVQKGEDERFVFPLLSFSRRLYIYASFIDLFPAIFSVSLFLISGAPFHSRVRPALCLSRFIFLLSPVRLYPHPSFSLFPHYFFLLHFFLVHCFFLVQCGVEVARANEKKSCYGATYLYEKVTHQHSQRTVKCLRKKGGKKRRGKKEDKTTVEEGGFMCARVASGGYILLSQYHTSFRSFQLVRL